MRGRRVGDHFSDGLSCAAERERGEGMEGVRGRQREVWEMCVHLLHVLRVDYLSIRERLVPRQRPLASGHVQQRDFVHVERNDGEELSE